MSKFTWKKIFYKTIGKVKVDVYYNGILIGTGYAPIYDQSERGIGQNLISNHLEINEVKEKITNNFGLKDYQTYMLTTCIYDEPKPLMAVRSNYP
jgi:hypothetical protein